MHTVPVLVLHAHVDEGIIDHALIILDHVVHIGLGGINLFRQLRLLLSLLFALYFSFCFYIISDHDLTP